MICTKCGNQVPDNTKFCTKCGNNLETVHQQDIAEKVCPLCNKPVKGNSFFCVHCGYNFGQDGATVEQDTEQHFEKYNDATVGSYKVKNKNNNSVLLILILIILIILIGLVYYMFFGGFSDKHGENDETRKTQVHEQVKETPKNDEENEKYDEDDTKSTEKTEEPIVEDDYLFPSDTKYITFDYLDTLSKDEVALIRNEIYARHGYVFKTEPYISYFTSKDWYKPNPFIEITDATFSHIELTNKNTIVEYETLRGWR